MVTNLHGDKITRILQWLRSASEESSGSLSPHKLPSPHIAYSLICFVQKVIMILTRGVLLHV